MNNSTIKKLGFMPSLIFSLFLLGMTFGSPKVEANPVNTPNKNTQLAWWAGGSGWYGGCGYGGGCGYRDGCGYNIAPVCGERCWRNRWGNIRCATNCWY